MKASPLLTYVDISQDVNGYVPSLDAVARYEVKAGRGAASPASFQHIPLPDPVTVSPAMVGRLWGFVPHLETLIVTNVKSINALPVELLRCPKLQIVTATPQLIIMPPPEITVGAQT